MSGRLEELVQTFLSGLPDRVVEATNLWLEFEEGKRADVVALKRVLHTIKGEAHMLGLEASGTLLQQLEEVVVQAGKAGERGRAAGNVVLEAMDALSFLAFQPGKGESDFDIGGVLEALRKTAQELAPGENESASEVHRLPTAGEQAEPAEAEAPESERRSENHVPVVDLQPTVHDLRRLYEEQQLLEPRLREIQRILRAVVAEMDPSLPPAVLGEQVVKTLGATADLERRLSVIRAQWSANAFAMGLALDQLSDTTRRAAVVSVARIRSTLERSVRATARALRKEVRLAFEGDAYIDSSIAQRLEPALLHAVRNAVDHGIEAPEVRTAAGKPARGSIAVRIEQQVSTVRVSIQDDGAGIDVAAVRERFGLPADVSDAHVIRYLFRSGVSTRDTISDISGRGVGLDVVAREAASVGGEVHAESTYGLGFRLVLTMPTVLRADLVVPVTYRGHRLALPCRNVEGFLRVDQIEETTAGAHARVRRDGNVESLPVYTLAPVFGTDDAPEAGRRGVLVTHDGLRFVLMVDEHGNPRPLPFQPIGELAIRSRVVRAVAPSPDGVRLLLDVQALVSVLQGVVVAALKPGERRVASVVVVEDAPVARELLCGILRSFGLTVHEAAHGREGLNRIRAVNPDLVLSDVEMPFLSGPEMIAELRAEPRFAELPVIVLTTDTSEATRQRVSALGVLGFLSKQKFVEGELRELVDLCLQHQR